MTDLPAVARVVDLSAPRPSDHLGYWTPPVDSWGNGTVATFAVPGPDGVCALDTGKLFDVSESLAALLAKRLIPHGVKLDALPLAHVRRQWLSGFDIVPQASITESPNHPSRFTLDAPGFRPVDVTPDVSAILEARQLAVLAGHAHALPLTSAHLVFTGDYRYLIPPVGSYPIAAETQLDRDEVFREADPYDLARWAALQEEAFGVNVATGLDEPGRSDADVRRSREEPEAPPRRAPIAPAGARHQELTREFGTADHFVLPEPSDRVRIAYVSAGVPVEVRVGFSDRVAVRTEGHVAEVAPMVNSYPGNFEMVIRAAETAQPGRVVVSVPEGSDVQIQTDSYARLWGRLGDVEVTARGDAAKVIVREAESVVALLEGGSRIDVMEVHSTSLVTFRPGDGNRTPVACIGTNVFTLAGPLSTSSDALDVELIIDEAGCLVDADKGVAVSDRTQAMADRAHDMSGGASLA